MTTPASMRRSPGATVLVVWIVGAAVMLIVPVTLGAVTERFGSVATATVLLAGLAACDRWWSRRGWIALAVAVFAVIVPGSTGEVISAALGCALSATLLVLLRRSDDRIPRQAAPEPSPTERVVRPHGAWRWLPPIIAWFAMALPVNLALSIAGSIAGTSPDARVVWDASNFLAIAREGYGTDPVLSASFPGYAMAIRAVSSLGIDAELAAILLSDLAGLLATVLFWAWCGRFLGRSSRLVALALFVTFPYAFVLFGVAYADGLLLALVFGSLVAVERQRYVLAGLLGALATFTRPNGLVLIVVLVVLVAERSGLLDVSGLGDRSAPLRDRVRSVGIHAERFESRQLGALLAPLGIAAFMFWMWREWDDPLFFWTVQTTDYGHRAFADPQTWLKVEFVNRPGEFVHNVPDALNQAIALVVIAACVASLPAVGRRFGWGYSVLGVGSLATLWVTATGFAPAGRYLLPFIPVVLALVAEPLERRRRMAVATVVVFAAGSVTLAAMFGTAFRLNW